MGILSTFQNHLEKVETLEFWEAPKDQSFRKGLLL